MQNTYTFDDISNLYAQNRFSRGEPIDITSLISSLTDKNLTNRSNKNLYHLAAENLDADTIRYLKEEGVKPRTDDYDNTPLHSLASFSDLKSYETKANDIYNSAIALIEAGVNPKKKNETEQTAYWTAGINSLYPFIKAMVDSDVKIDIIGSEGKNIVHTICDKIYHRKKVPGAVEAAYKTIEIIMDSGMIDLEDTDIFEKTPLYYAQRAGVKEIAALLSGDTTALETGGMGLHQAVLNRDLQAVEALLKEGTDVNQFSDEHKKTALMISCEYPNLDMVNLLIKHEADINLKSGTSGAAAVYYLLQDALANLNRGVKGGQSQTVIRKILLTLIDNGLDVNNPIDNNGNTPLIYLVANNSLSGMMNTMSEDLIEAGSNLNQTNNGGQTALMFFAYGGDEDRDGIAELLLDNKADCTLTDASSNTALMYAAANPNKMSAKRIAGLILEADSSIANSANNAGKTAMDMAVENNNEALVKVLLTNM